VTRDLPRGQFGAYLRAHCLTDNSSVLPRFSMGCGAIFMIQRVKPLEESLAVRGTIAETDPSLLKEMISLVAAQKLDVVSLPELKRRLLSGDRDSPFVCFTFDGAYRSIKDTVFPLFRKWELPFAVYVGADYLDTDVLPWWVMLEVLVKESARVTLDIGGEPEDLFCRSLPDKRSAYATLFRRLKSVGKHGRKALLEAALKRHGVRQSAVFEREMLSGDELRALSQSNLVTIGSLAGGSAPLSEMSYDHARDTLRASLDDLEKAIDARARHLAFPGGLTGTISARDVGIAREFDLETAVTNVEGALWPEHAREPLALPRIALDNDPATLVRALMLGGGRLPGGGAVFRKAV